MYILIKDEKIVQRKPYKFEKVLPKLYLSDKGRWTKDKTKARLIHNPNFSIADRFSNKYMYKFEKY